MFSYAIGPRKLSANEQFFLGAQTVVSLLQTTQIISHVCFMLPCCLRQLKSSQTRLNRRRTLLSIFIIIYFLSIFFITHKCVSCLRACLGARLLPQSYQYPHSEHRFPAPSSKTSAWSLISTQTFRRVLTASVDSCAEIKSASPVGVLWPLESVTVTALTSRSLGCDGTRLSRSSSLRCDGRGCATDDLTSRSEARVVARRNRSSST